MTSSENSNLTNPRWVAMNQKESTPVIPRIVHLWLGLTAICVHCGQLVEVVDLADEGPGIYPVGTFDWRHGHGYFSCNRDGGWPMAEPSL